ncbi:MAG: DUF2007 domain-containing protein [Bdellovibrionales bacterium]|nr:DUF2007 domain-containing protein [Bdellovibrionales bacterium]
MADLAHLCTCSSRPETDIIRNLLESEGIHCVVQSDDAGGLRPFVNAASGVDILVNPKDLARAQEVIKAATSGAPAGEI